jgi:hypothetical protein
VADLASYLDRLTKRQLIIAVTALALDKGIDVATGGVLNKMTRKALIGTARILVPAAGRAALSVGGTGLGVSRLVMRNPYILGAAAIYVGYQERERIKQLLDQGYEFVEERLPTPSLPSLPSPGPIPGVEEIITAGQQRGMAARLPIPSLPSLSRLQRRRPSTFNKAVSAGMKAIKKSTSYGKKGTISPAKKAFTLVTKLASAKKKKKKAPKSGIRRRIWNAMKGLR